MIFPFSYDFPMVFLWFSYGFPIETSIFPWFHPAECLHLEPPRGSAHWDPLGTCGWTGSGRFNAELACAAQHMPWFGWFPEALDWIVGENLNRKPMGFYHQIDRA